MQNAFSLLFDDEKTDCIYVNAFGEEYALLRIVSAMEYFVRSMAVTKPVVVRLRGEQEVEAWDRLKQMQEKMKERGDEQLIYEVREFDKSCELVASLLD